MLLSALWLDLKNSALGLDATRDLHVEWLLIAEWPNVTGTTCTTVQQSAAASTLCEVLVADDDDGNLYNGTPHCDIICAVFRNRNIIDTTICAPELCPEAAGHPCVADCDRSTGRGVLDVFDYLCFQARFSRGDERACNCDTSTGPMVCDVFDFICFQRLFAEGCP